MVHRGVGGDKKLTLHRATAVGNKARAQARARQKRSKRKVGTKAKKVVSCLSQKLRRALSQSWGSLIKDRVSGGSTPVVRTDREELDEEVPVHKE